MARLASSLLLILLVPLAGAIADPADDVTERAGGPPVLAPAVDIRNVTATLEGGILSMRLETYGELLIGDQAPAPNASREYVYLFIVVFDADDNANLYDHVASGGDSITAICTYHEGLFDLGCRVTSGDAPLRGAGASGRNVTVRFDVQATQHFAVGGSSHLSVPNGTQRRIVAQDFTSNALPYQGLPGGETIGEGGTTGEALKTPWWRTPSFVFLAIAAAIFVIGMVVPWEWFQPSHWRKK